ncbi:unnamed protein product, partial [Prorocentrum cordatum]
MMFFNLKMSIEDWCGIAIICSAVYDYSTAATHAPRATTHGASAPQSSGPAEFSKSAAVPSRVSGWAQARSALLLALGPPLLAACAAGASCWACRVAPMGPAVP